MAYDLSDLQAAVQDDLKDSSFNSTRITRYLNRGQRVIFNTHTFRFCEKSIEGDLTVGEFSYAQQADHDATIGGSLVDPDDDTVVMQLDEKNYMPHREFFDLYPSPENSDNRRPSAWTEFGNEVFFNFPVDEAYIFNQRYYRTPTDLEAADDVPDVPETFRELLEFYALYRAEKYRGNHDVAATYRQDFEDGLEAMVMRYAGTTSIGPSRVRQRRMRTGDY